MDIGLIGYSRTGKDSIAAHLVANHGYRRIAFADPLKALAVLADPILVGEGGREDGGSGPMGLAEAVDTYGEDGTKARYPEYVSFLEHLGAGVREVFGADTWLRRALEDVHAAREAGHPVVITDVRYLNEASTLRYLGFTMARVVRPGVGPQSAHPSATSLDSYAVDTTVYNVTDLDDLHRVVDAWVS